jgi:xylulokinase
VKIVGIDLGTQSVKVVVTDDRLTIVGAHAAAVSTRHPQPTSAEQDVSDWEQALARALPVALEKAGVKPADVVVIGVSGQLDGCVAVDERGAAVTPCLIWMDRRAQSEMPALDVELVRATTGVVVDPSHMAAKIRWLKKQTALPKRVRFHQPVSYLVERMTGRAVFDHGLASTTMLYSLEAKNYHNDLLRAFGIAAAELPEISEATAVAGKLSAEAARWLGLPAGIVVAVGTGDDFATPLGAGLQPGSVLCALGTAEVVGALSERAVLDERALVETHAYPGGRYFIENPGWLSGGAMRWLCDLFGWNDFETMTAAAAEVGPGADDVLFLPALSGAMAPEWNADARGAFYGLTAAHGRGHMARALLEGCAFAMRDVIEALERLGVASRDILLTGGGARSKLWAEIRADVAQRPVAIVDNVDSCPLGAAMMAAVAGGVVPDLECARTSITGQRQMVQPKREHRAVYDRAYVRYRLLFDALKPMYS